MIGCFFIWRLWQPGDGFFGPKLTFKSNRSTFAVAGNGRRNRVTAPCPLATQSGHFQR
jgi:hypothetical protein